MPGGGVFSNLFGWPGTWGTGGNLVAWVICGGAAAVWLRAKLKAHHLAEMAQARKHHAELLAQAQEHHDATQRLLAAHCTELKQHITDTAGKG